MTWCWTGQTLPLLLAWLLLALLLLLRSLGTLLHAEFWGEDGWAWFPDAYNHGAASLLLPLAGYLQSLSRLVGLAAQALPMAWAPTVFAAVGLAVQALPPAFLISDRLHDAWPSAPSRLGFALLWIALPNSKEVYVNLTNAQWHLAALAFLVLLSRPPKGRGGQAADIAILLLSGLSGPYCLMLLPVAAWQMAGVWHRAASIGEGRITAAWRGGVVAAAAMIQAAVLLHGAADRTRAPLGAEPLLFARIVAQQVILAPLIGQSHMARLQALPLWRSGLLPVTVLVCGMMLAMFAWLRGPSLLRKACMLGGLVLLAALVRPQVSQSGSQWALLQLPGVGQRYYYLPMLAWAGVIFWLLSARWLPVRLAGGVLVAGLLFGVWSDWAIPDRQPTHYRERVKAFMRLPSGAAMAFPVNPLMDLLPMILIRK